MYPALYNLRVHQGSTFYRKITVRNRTTNVPTDFTNFLAKMDIKTRIGAQPIVSLTTENGGITLSSQGVIELKIAPSESKLLKYPTLLYDLDVISSSGDIYTYLHGNVLVLLEVTV